jgi:hypothetical protein
VAALGQKIAAFSVEEDEFDGSLSLEPYGVDSLVAVELRSWLNDEAEADVCIFDVIQSASVSVLARADIGMSRVVTLSADESSMV